MRTEENFLTYENIFSYVRKFIFLRKKISRLAQRKKSASARRFFFPPNSDFFASARKKISAYAKIFFRICGNKFSYIRKFDALQTRWECGFCGRVFLCPKKGALTGEGRGPICGGTGAFAPRKKKAKCLGGRKAVRPALSRGIGRGARLFK